MQHSVPQIEQVQEVQQKQVKKEELLQEKQEKAQKKRKILMKQKCNYINHQIDLNLSKLDELMNMIKQKKDQHQENRLKTIKEIDQSNEFTEQSVQNKEQNLNQDFKTKEKRIKLRKQRRLKFKYSILREYQFQENKQQQFQIKHQLRQDNLGGEGERNKFVHQQELLLEGLVQKDSKKQVQFYTIQQIQCVNIQTRYDWINKYLNKESFNGDTVVKTVTQNHQQQKTLEVIKYEKKMDMFECQLIKSDKEQQRKQAQNQQTQISLPYNQFINKYPQVSISFPKHTRSLDIIHPQMPQVVKLDLTSFQRLIRVLVKTQNINQKHMQRVMIFKQLPSSTIQAQEKYKITWTHYDKNSFVDDVILQGGFNYLITNLCCNPSSLVSLIFNPQDIPQIKIKKTKYDPWKSYNILCSSFQQCSKVFMSQNVYDDSKPLEFLRSNFLDYGLVLEIYQNINSQKVAFLDTKEQKQNKQEDIQILFPQIYTQLQNKNVYFPQQLVIKFFEVTEKPARLYFPQKRVLIGSKIAQHVTIHSTFK